MDSLMKTEFPIVQALQNICNFIKAIFEFIMNFVIKTNHVRDLASDAIYFRRRLKLSNCQYLGGEYKRCDTRSFKYHTRFN